ncbi:MAG: fibronectin type III domain-containing protein [Coriobacteriales bacterium]|nr:fibronectin type III domain-containing protein [Coriobacteriales bacterium]
MPVEKSERIDFSNYGKSSSGTVAIGDTLTASDTWSKYAPYSHPDYIGSLDFVHTVSFSPNGNLRNDHVAIVGYIHNSTIEGKTYDHRLVLIVYNSENFAWSKIIDVGEMSWIGDTCFDEVENQISVTAGDYDGDGKDTVCIYWSTQSSDWGIVEYDVKSSGKDITATQKSKDQAKALLNPEYVAKASSIYDACDGKDKGKGSLHAILKTGNFGGDNAEDLAVLSSTETCNCASSFSYRVEVPYLSICFGKNGGSNFLSNSADKDSAKYVENSVCSNGVKPAITQTETLFYSNMAVGRLDKTGLDSIIVVGSLSTIDIQGNGNWNGENIPNYDLAFARYDCFNSDPEDSCTQLKQCYFTDYMYYESGDLKKSESNGMQSYGNDASGEDVQSPIATQALYMNGQGNAAYFMIDGDIYQWKPQAQYPQRVYANSYLDTKHSSGAGYSFSKNFISISAIATGNFDGNKSGYEQIFYRELRKEKGSNDFFWSHCTIALNQNAHNQNTGLPNANIMEDSPFDTGFDNSKLFWASSKDVQGEKGFHDYNQSGAVGNHYQYGICCAVDYNGPDNYCSLTPNKYDGLTAKYKEKMYDWADPQVLAILQAGPYFSEVNQYKKNDNNTSLVITHEEGSMQGLYESSSHSDGVSVSYYGYYGQNNLTAATTDHFTNEYRAGHVVSTGSGVSTGDENLVYLYRPSVNIYLYDIFNNETNEWEKESFSVSCVGKPLAQTFRVKDYNVLAKAYKDLIGNDESVRELTEITEAYLTDNEGKPENYKDSFEGDVLWTGKYNTHTQSRSSSGSAEHDLHDVTFEEEQSFQHDNGMTFSFSNGIGNKSVDKSKGTERYIRVGVSKEWSYAWGQSKQISQSTTFQFDCDIYNYNDDAANGYQLDWQFGCWKSEIPCYDSNMKEIDGHKVPVIGFSTSNIYRGVDPPEDPNGGKGNGDGQGNAGTQGNDGAQTNGGTQTNGADKNNGYDKSTTENTQKTGAGKQVASATGLAPYAYADENESGDVKSYVITWKPGDNPDGTKYQVYTSVNGEVVPVGEPTADLSYVFDIEKANAELKDKLNGCDLSNLPVYQFRIAALNDDGCAGPPSGWVYCTSNKFLEKAAVYTVELNPVSNDNRLKILHRSEGDKDLSANSILLSTLQNSRKNIKISHFNNGDTINDFDLATKSGVEIDSIKRTGKDGCDNIFALTFNKAGAGNSQAYLVRIPDGKTNNERAIDEKITSLWPDADALKAAILNPETSQATIEQLEEIKSEIASIPGFKFTGDTYMAYKAGMETVDGLNSGTIKPYADPKQMFAIIGGIFVVVALAACVTYFATRRRHK